LLKLIYKIIFFSFFVVSMLLFGFGINLLHTSYNNNVFYPTSKIFGISLDNDVIFDIGLLFIYISMIILIILIIIKHSFFYYSVSNNF